MASATKSSSLLIQPACPLINEKGKVVKDSCGHRVGCYLVILKDGKCSINIEHAKGLQEKMKNIASTGLKVLLFGKDPIPKEYAGDVQRILALYFSSIKNPQPDAKHPSYTMDSSEE